MSCHQTATLDKRTQIPTVAEEQVEITQRAHDVVAALNQRHLTLIQRRNNVVCPVGTTTGNMRLNILYLSQS